MEPCLAKDWYWVLVAFSLSIGIALEDWLRTPLASVGKMGKYGRVSSCCDAPTRCMICMRTCMRIITL
eukprot:5501624-Prymnesium_polylepis.1